MTLPMAVDLSGYRHNSDFSPLATRLATSWRHCVDFPHLSPPSSTINAPREIADVVDMAETSGEGFNFWNDEERDSKNAEENDLDEIQIRFRSDQIRL